MPAKEFEPTEAQRLTVRTMAGYGIPHRNIAACIKIAPGTLRKHFADELDEGEGTGNVNIGRSLYEQAVGRPAQYDERGRLLSEELKPDKSVAIFLGKARLGMRDRPHHDVPPPGYEPTIELDLTVFTDDELETFMRLYDKAKRGAQHIDAEIEGVVMLEDHT